MGLLIEAFRLAGIKYFHGLNTQLKGSLSFAFHVDFLEKQLTIL